MELIAIAAAGLSTLIFLVVWGPYTFRMKINVEVFFNQVHKLVLANNIDRGIKLCNAEPNALAPMVMKHMLVRANRPHEIELCYHEALAMTGGVKFEEGKVTKPSPIYGLLGRLLVFGCYVIFAGILLTASGFSELMTVCFAVMVVTSVLTLWTVGSMKQHINAIRFKATLLRTMLLSRANYIPSQYKPRKMTPEEIAEWRRNMDGFNEDVMRDRNRGDQRPVEEIYEEKADDRGVLPPI